MPIVDSVLSTVFKSLEKLLKGIVILTFKLKCAKKILLQVRALAAAEAKLSIKKIKKTSSSFYIHSSLVAFLQMCSYWDFEVLPEVPIGIKSGISVGTLVFQHYFFNILNFQAVKVMLNIDVEFSVCDRYICTN